MILYTDVDERLTTLEQKGLELSQSIQTAKHFSDPNHNRRASDRRVLKDRRDNEQGEPHEKRDLRRLPRRSNQDRRLPPNERLELLQNELSSILLRQSILIEGKHALSLLEPSIETPMPNY